MMTVRSRLILAIILMTAASLQAGSLELSGAFRKLSNHLCGQEVLQKHARLLKGKAFKTSDYFPGGLEPPQDIGTAHRVKIKASCPEAWGCPVMNAEDPARRPTGCYLVPGRIVRVTVPAALVNRGYAVRIGAHSWDLNEKTLVKRLDRVSLVYPIEKAELLVAHPLGGGIYIEVPVGAEAGVVDIKIENAVRAPFYSARSLHQTSPEEWNKERMHPGPWADFESDRFMMQVPSAWIRTLDDPHSKMSMPDHWLLKGPQTGGAITFHETGHAQLFTKFKGEVEAVVNLPFVAVLNNGFGVDLDTAFGKSFNNEHISLDQAAIMWMVTENFRTGKPMNITNSSKNEVRYLHRGYGKYVEIVNLFGWGVLEQFWHSVHLDYLEGMTYLRNADPTDHRILRLSECAGTDLTPLIHFWGIQPEEAEELAEELAKKGLKSSAKIYDRLMYYKSIIPMSPAEFKTHALTVYPDGIKAGKSPDFGVGWYHAWLPKYTATHGQAAQAALQQLIDPYYPAGRPVDG